ncbi:MAG: hypothetical protein A2Y84_00880 [Candidatus Colwellbacteria bacterium RBG_13_48_8]|uniref:Membrane insertase YidC/Oxa/ALB C-terminal domain-containing protein n=1 Tax=Candidatus Colwellbacteria bacterium RBG_13_48_8 TaxID=1797685 RepID=A0A1G1YUV8_9BACT|nr:MAG: hypothetical protein A2Y84_00880 [Candidatus Colwellbacteria bacterium RBG_13_48_8]
MKEIFTEFLYRPLFNALVWLYQNVAFQDLGVAIILLTLVVRLLLFPLFQKMIRHQQITQNLQPEIKRIQKKYKQDKETQAKEIIGLYNQHKINPLTPIIVLLVQAPIIFALYRIFMNGFSNGAFNLLYSFINLPEFPSQSFLGMIDLTKASLALTVLTALLQYLQGRLALRKISKNKDSKEEGAAEKMGRRMTIIAPALVFLFLVNLPAAIGLYWSTTTVFSIAQQAVVARSLNKSKGNSLLLGGDEGDRNKNSQTP